MEYLFGYFKNEYYKHIFNNKNEQLDKINEIFNSNETKENMECFFLQGFQKYTKFYEESGLNISINDLWNDISSVDKEDESQKSYEK